MANFQSLKDVLYKTCENLMNNAPPESPNIQVSSKISMPRVDWREDNPPVSKKEAIRQDQPTTTKKIIYEDDSSDD